MKTTKTNNHGKGAQRLFAACAIFLIMPAGCWEDVDTKRPCPEGSTECNEICVDTLADRNHCGGCDQPCQTGESCVDGQCTVLCSGSTPTLCGDSCVNTSTDRNHCGECNSACAPGEVCSGGECGLECGGDTPLLCGDSCVNTSTDRNHCGECDNACAPGEVCSGGDCGLECGGDTPMLCGDSCVNTSTDRNHCGGCDTACAPGEVCSGGDCGLECGGDTPMLCGDSCVNTSTDRNHCGECNSACAPGEVCSGGVCELECGGGTTLCGDACVDTDTSRYHCGGCDQACGISEVCNLGQCLKVSIFTEVVSGGLSCTTMRSNTGRKVGVDDAGNIYIAMLCEGGEVYVAVSSDGGFSFEAPIHAGGVLASEVAVVGGPAGSALLAQVTSGGGLAFTRTMDGGETFEPWMALRETGVGSNALSIVRDEDLVLVSGQGGSGMLVFGNPNLGAGDIADWTAVDLSIPVAYGSLVLDSDTGDIWAVSDTPDFHLRQSRDRGETFDPVINPPGIAFYSDWVAAAGFIYVSGTDDNNLTYRIPMDEPHTSEQITGIHWGTWQRRAITADPLGNAFVCDEDAGIAVQRVSATAVEWEPAVRISDTGTYPVCHSPAPDLLITAFTDGTQVKVSILWWN